MSNKANYIYFKGKLIYLPLEDEFSKIENWDYEDLFLKFINCEIRLDETNKYIIVIQDLLLTTNKINSFICFGNEIVKYLARKLKNNNMFRIHLIRINDEQDSLEHINSFYFQRFMN